MAVFKDKIVFVPKEAYEKILPKEGIVVGRAKTPVPAIPPTLKVDGMALMDHYKPNKLPPDGTYALVLDEQKFRKRYLTCQVIQRDFRNAFEPSGWDKAIFTIDTTQVQIPEQDVSILRDTLPALRKSLNKPMLEKFLEEIYPGNWDVTEVGDCYQVIIRWPEATIKNGSNSHLMRDLYVRFELSKATLAMPVGSAIQGLRGTITEEEFIAGYAQSHLNAHNSVTWAGFCLGEGTMPDLILKLRAATKPTETLLFGFLLQLDDYIKWESIEGVPYINMGSIGRAVRSFERDVGESAGTTGLINNQALGLPWHKTYAHKLFEHITNPLHPTPKPKDPLFIMKAGVSPIVILNTGSLEVCTYLKKVIGSIVESNYLQRFNVTQWLYVVDQRTSGRDYLRSNLDSLKNYENSRGPVYKGQPIKFQVIDKKRLVEPSATANKDDEIIMTCGPGAFILLIQHINAWLYEAVLQSTDNLLWKTPTTKQPLLETSTDTKQNS